MYIYTDGIFQSVILVSIFMLWVYVTFYLFFKIWLTELILIFREQIFKETCFLLASNALRHKFFPVKISGLHCNGAAQTCNKKLWRKVADEYQISKSPFFQRRDDSLMSKYPWNETNIIFTWVSSLHNPFKGLTQHILLWILNFFRF